MGPVSSGVSFYFLRLHRSNGWWDPRTAQIDGRNMTGSAVVISSGPSDPTIWFGFTSITATMALFTKGARLIIYIYICFPYGRLWCLFVQLINFYLNLGRQHKYLKTTLGSINSTQRPQKNQKIKMLPESVWHEQLVKAVSTIHRAVSGARAKRLPPSTPIHIWVDERRIRPADRARSAVTCRCVWSHRPPPTVLSFLKHLPRLKSQGDVIWWII